MQYDPKTGLCPGILYKHSPNQDERPERDISLIVIHGISLPPGQFGSEHIDKLFLNQLQAQDHPFFAQIKDLHVSSHFLIRRDGCIVQYVPVQKRAWHAGVSKFKERTHCNDFSIGVELEGSDEIAYEEIQYQKLVELLKVLVQYYPAIEKENIVGHCDIAPGRKTDPGPSFSWQKFWQLWDEIS